MQVRSRSTCGERSFGYKGEKAKTRQVNHAKVEAEEKNGGNKEGVA